MIDTSKSFSFFALIENVEYRNSHGHAYYGIPRM